MLLARLERHDSTAWSVCVSAREVSRSWSHSVCSATCPGPLGGSLRRRGENMDTPDVIAAEYLRRGGGVDIGGAISRGWALVRDNMGVLIGASVLCWLMS